MCIVTKKRLKSGKKKSQAVSSLNLAAPQSPSELNKYLHNEITEEWDGDEGRVPIRRGPKKKGEFKKVTLNLDVSLNRKLDEYILGLKQQCLKNGNVAPSKSEWVRDVVEEKLRELGLL